MQRRVKRHGVKSRRSSRRTNSIEKVMSEAYEDSRVVIGGSAPIVGELLMLKKIHGGDTADCNVETRPR
jgi:hypothetical protein